MSFLMLLAMPFFIATCLAIYKLKTNEIKKVDNNKARIWFALSFGVGIFLLIMELFISEVLITHNYWKFSGIAVILVLLYILGFLNEFGKLPDHRIPKKQAEYLR